MSEEDSVKEEYSLHLHSAAASGDVASIEIALKGVPNVNARNNRGWTALMFAARNGHVDAVKILLKNGADPTMINSIGQTAFDIAEFWQHTAVASCLKGEPSSKRDTDPPKPSDQLLCNHFSGSPLNRASEYRRDTEWLNKLQSSPHAVYILFKDLQPIGLSSDSSKLKRFHHSPNIQHLIDSGAAFVFLGVELNDSESAVYLPHSLDPATAVGWFAIDATSASAEIEKEFTEDSALVSIPFGMMQMSRSEAAILSQARSMLAWHDRYQFCPTCGKATVIKEAGYKRECVDQECRSNKDVEKWWQNVCCVIPFKPRNWCNRIKTFRTFSIHNTCYPRTDPTVIMAILSADRTMVLLGRAKRFPSKMWSCLAGFMEPGESVEEACRREVFEESGIRVGKVEYHSSQPWPMPSSLMIGCIGYAESNTIKVDKEELEDARWFKVQDLRQMLTHQHPDKLFCPPEQAIAHQLIKHCVLNIAKL